jgi:hypothetical protein
LRQFGRGQKEEWEYLRLCDGIIFSSAGSFLRSMRKLPEASEYIKE